MRSQESVIAELKAMMNRAVEGAYAGASASVRDNHSQQDVFNHQVMMLELLLACSPASLLDDLSALAFVLGRAAVRAVSPDSGEQVLEALRILVRESWRMELERRRG